MLNNRRLLNGDITYSAAKGCESNILHELGYYDQKTRFFNHLYKYRDQVEEIVVHHLNLSSKNACSIADPQDWRHGSFNLCIPVDVRGHDAKRVMVRFPLPYRVGEKPHPGNADEKILCEAGTYAWLQENCPEIPIPNLYGFGLSSGLKFTECTNLPFFTRVVFYIRRRFLQWLGRPLPTRYVPHRSRKPSPEGVSYLLLEHIDGALLSDTWESKRQDPNLRNNLFRGVSQLMLSAARIPLPRIGSFTIDKTGFLSLTNRPLTLEIHDLENQKIPMNMPRDAPYSTTSAYVDDMLAFHENRLRHQPNAVNDMEDCLYQMSALTVMRTIWPSFFARDLRTGPFYLSFTDLHPSNLFVDSEWNIKCVIDLEWTCSRPVEMIHPPYWLGNQPVDAIDVDDYQPLHEEFLTTLAEEENKLVHSAEQQQRLYPVLRRGWENGTFWYALALDSPMGLFKIFYDYIQPRFAEEHLDDPAFFRIIMAYWGVGAMGFVQAKVKDRERYEKRLRKAFQI
ncbi:hypothetical protein FE257_008980 [Aspergillus nanangensis]|uniref:Aminoglycoside phosphotransferase domain-containing protein n=1 Tax=Aspergillus nanangensis TaxID=2582783 RepID=A0AAD4CWI4_ASPNN|nr:hypothetical protein FE257_008980 [Aspergillus nanangensis]